MPSSSSSSPSPTSSAPHSTLAGNSAVDSVPGGLPLLEVPPGFRFSPTDADMVYLLRRKVSGLPVHDYAIRGFHPPRDLDVSLFEPQELPPNNDVHYRHVSYFFTTRSTNALPGGDWPRRPTPRGCWKGTRTGDRQIGDSHRGGAAGFKKMFIYYRGKAPNEVKTVWMMKEVRLNPRWEQHRNLDSQKMQSCVMCKVYNYLDEEEGTDDHEAYEEDD